MLKKSLSSLVFVFLFCSLLSGQAIYPDTKTQSGSIPQLLTSIKVDLQTLRISIDGYKTKIANLQNLIDLSLLDLKTSQDDLAQQKILLADSLDKLQQMEKQYSELLKTFNALNLRYQKSLKSGRIKNYIIGGLGVSLAASIGYYFMK